MDEATRSLFGMAWLALKEEGADLGPGDLHKAFMDLGEIGRQPAAKANILNYHIGAFPTCRTVKCTRRFLNYIF